MTENMFIPPIQAEKTVDDLRSRRSELVAEMEQIVDGAKRANRNLTPDEATRYDARSDELKSVDMRIKFADSVDRSTGIQGVPGELLTPAQSWTEYRNALCANGFARRTDPVDFDIEAYWAQRCGLARPGAELRARGEDTVTGSGAGQPITPQSWVDSVVDLLRANLVMSQAGLTSFQMSTEKVNVPVLSADIQPVYLAENANVDLDGNSAFAPLQFDSAGAHQAMALVSRQLMQDAYVQGGLAGFLRNAVAQRYARYVESGILYGLAGTPANGVPGLVNETGIQAIARSAAETDTTLYSIAAEDVRTANAEPTAFIASPKVHGSLSRITGSSGYPAYYPVPSDVADIPRLGTTTVPVATATPATSEMFAGDFSKVMLGIRSDLDITVLLERYASSGQVGLWVWGRFAARVAHPESFVHVTGIQVS